MLIVTVLSLAKAFHKLHVSGEYTEVVDGTLKGEITPGTTMTEIAKVSALGGPAGLALLVGVSAGLLATKATEKASVNQISDFVAGRTRNVALEARRLSQTESRRLYRYNPRHIFMRFSKERAQG